ncbi:MAG: DUF4132 domain-containing protein [Clostridia bacterium]|nr:DUF4132 domain-containing protein [Clostridia bacterium]
MNDKSLLSELKDMFVLGRDMPAARWRQRMEGKAFQALANRLVWQSDGARFMPGDSFVPEGPVSLAHPVELDAEEILRWRARLSEREITQPFRQMRESVVLADGQLPGKARQVQSAGERYRMLDRYCHYHLPLSDVQDLKSEGFQFIVRHRFDRDRWRKAEIQVVNIVTPAGILYECRPDAKIEKLSAEDDVSLILGPFYPFEGVRLRTLNHAAAALEEQLIPEMAERDALDMLLPHLPGMPVKRMKRLLGLCDGEGKTAAMLSRLIALEEVARS